MKRKFLYIPIILMCLNLFAEINLTVSKNSYNVKGSANTFGVYPVNLNWTKTKDAKYFAVYRSINSNKDFELIKELPSENSSNQTFIDINPNAKPGIKYFYKVVSYNTPGKQELSIEESTIIEGWGALTHEAYFLLYDKSVKVSHSHLTLMHKKGNLNKLGKEKINGNISGTLSYKTTIKISGFSGVVNMDYENYTDDKIMILDGNMDTVANVHGIGSMSGTVKITGMYPGAIFYDNVEIKNSTAGGGTYGVQPNGLSRKELDYLWTFKDSL